MKIDFGFSFNSDYSVDVSGGAYDFLKINYDEALFSDISRSQYSYCVFEQGCDGKVYSFDKTLADASSSRRVYPGGDNLSAGVYYHYILEYIEGKYARAYITDEKGTVVQEQFNTTDSDSLNQFYRGFHEWNGPTGLRMGDFAQSQYLKGLEYRNITFYTADTNYVDPAPSSDEDKYLFAYFTGNTNDGEKLRYAVSTDGINFAPLNRGEPVWNPDNFNASDIDVYPDNSGNIGVTKHIRDPYIFKGQNGKYYVLATDLSTPDYGFNNNSKLLVWELDNPEDIDETTPWSIDAWDWFAEMCGGYVNRSWAPQAIWDPVEEMYMMYWAIGYVEGKTVMYYIYTPDFKTFVGTPKRLVNYGNADNIDGDITYSESEGLYYLWYKNELTSTLGYATSPTCCGPYTNTQTIQANDGLEGCQVHQLTDGSYILLADAYGAGYFKVYPSDTLSGFNDSNIADSDINWLAPRHGSVVRITTAQYNALVNKFGVRSETDDLEYYFSEGRDWTNVNYTKDIKDQSKNTYTLGATEAYKTTSGTLEITNGNLFIENDKARNILKGDAFTLTFKHKLTEAYKYTQYYNMMTVGNADQDFIALAEDGTFYVGGKACPKKATTQANVESEYTICFNGSTVSLLQNGEYVTGALFNETISEAENGTLYVGVGWSDKTMGGRTSGTYRDFVLSPNATISGHENEYLDDYLDDFDFDEISAPADFNAFSYHMSHVAVGGYSNVVYSPINTTVWDGNGTPNDSYVQIGRMNFKIATPNTMVLVYDGVHEVSYPVVLEQIRQQSSNDSQLIHYVGSHESIFALQNDWVGYTKTYSVWPANNIVSSDTFAYLDNNNYDESDNLNNGDYHFYSNRMIYNGSGDTDNYYEVATNDKYYVKNSYKDTFSSRQYKYGDITSYCTRYVINYAPVYKMLSGETKVPGTSMGIVDYYNNVVKGNEDKYTESSVKQFYITMAAIKDSDPNNYNFSTTASSVKTNASTIKKAVSEFEKINLVEKADFSELENAYESADALLNELSSSPAKYSNNSVSALVSAVNNAYLYKLSDSEKKNTSKAEKQSDIDFQALAINNAVSSLSQTTDELDLSSYTQAVAVAANPDQDIYSCTKEETKDIIEVATDFIIGEAVEYKDINGDDIEIPTISDNADQAGVDGVTTMIISFLTSNIKEYTVTVNGNATVSFKNNGSDEKISDNIYKATYNNTAVFTSESEETAWYMTFASASINNNKQYQASGESYQTNVIGDITVWAKSRNEENPNKVTVVRDYQNGIFRVQLVDFVNDTFELPDAPALLGYEFVGYFVGDSEVSSSIHISKDTTVIARYQKKSQSGYSVEITSTTGDVLYSQENDEYNTKVMVSDDNAYGWVEKVQGTDTYRPFYIGKNLTFFVAESTEIKAVNQAEFNSYNFSFPVMNARQSTAKTEVLENGTKAYFNGQIVEDPTGEIKILEYGYLIGKPINRIPSESELILENAGDNDDFRIIRGKSTKKSGANQFTVAVSKLSGTVSYRGYITYQIGGTTGEIKTVYTDYRTLEL